MSRLSSGEKEFLAESADAVPVAAAPSEPGMEVIDARGISPPLPLLRAHRALRTMKPGQMLKVVTSTRDTLAEFQALAKYVVSYELVSQEEAGDEVVHVLRRRR